ncbi:MAG: hypothetical protein AB1679_01225 [Actinomycetota bacterium]|jgi:hypothetical protein
MTNVTMASSAVLSPSVLDHCPGCAGGPLFAVFNGEEMNFLCQACSVCWHAGSGWVRRVDPLTCPGCEWRGACLSRFDCARWPVPDRPSLVPARGQGR